MSYNSLPNLQIQGSNMKSLPSVYKPIMNNLSWSKERESNRDGF